jgi:hypothetical protein
MKKNRLNRLEYLKKIFDLVRFYKPETKKSQPNQTGLVKNKPN